MKTNTELITREEGEWVHVPSKCVKVSNTGLIQTFNRKDWKIRKISKGTHGYMEVGVRINNTTKSFLVHRLVAMAFIQNPENKPEVNHKNGDILDNRSSNLEWATRSENQLHAYRTGLDNKKGVRNSAAKLTESQVLKIRQSKEFGTTLGRKYGVSHTVIYGIKNRKIWKHL